MANTIALIIAAAQSSERGPLVALQRRASLAHESDRAALLAHPDAIDLPLRHIESGCVMVARRDGTIVGFCVVLRRADRNAELDGLFVEPSAWRSGIGRALVEAACASARSEGAAALHVIAGREAAGFYQACGFELLGEAPTRFGPALAMRRTLAR
jgi:GNAT superfamily N-acetyltransferase